MNNIKLFESKHVRTGTNIGTPYLLQLDVIRIVSLYLPKEMTRMNLIELFQQQGLGGMATASKDSCVNTAAWFTVTEVRPLI